MAFFGGGATGRLSLKASHFLIPIQHNLRVHNSKLCLTKIQVLDLTGTWSHSQSLNTFPVYTIKYTHTSFQERGPKGNGWGWMEGPGELFLLVRDVKNGSKSGIYIPGAPAQGSGDTGWAFSASKVTLRNIKRVRSMLKGKVILTRDVSLSCIDFQLWVEETLQTDI